MRGSYAGQGEGRLLDCWYITIGYVFNQEPSESEPEFLNVWRPVFDSASLCSLHGGPVRRIGLSYGPARPGIGS